MSLLKKPGILIFLVAVLLIGCTFTQTYTPQFNDKQTAVLDTIRANYGFEDITIVAKKKSGAGGKHCALTVKFINGKNVPADDGKMMELAKQLGAKIKTMMKYPKEFDSYIILFSTIQSNGNTTNENYTGHEFKPDEL